MRLRNAVAVVSTLALGAGAVLATAPAASAAQGNRSLAKVLTSDGNRSTRRHGDFDIATEAVLAVLDAKPGSPVAVLHEGQDPGHRVRADRPGLQGAGLRPDRHLVLQGEEGLQRRRERSASTPSRRSCSTTSWPARP